MKQEEKRSRTAMDDYSQKNAHGIRKIMPASLNDDSYNFITYQEKLEFFWTEYQDNTGRNDRSKTGAGL